MAAGDGKFRDGDIYGEVTTSGFGKYSSPPRERILFFDCDRDLTLMDCIKDVRNLIKDADDDEVITLYFVSGKLTTSYLFTFQHLWSYLNETGKNFNVVFRGNVPHTADTIFETNIPVFLSKDVADIVAYKNMGYKFSIL